MLIIHQCTYLLKGKLINTVSWLHDIDTNELDRTRDLADKRIWKRGGYLLATDILPNKVIASEAK